MAHRGVDYVVENAMNELCEDKRYIFESAYKDAMESFVQSITRSVYFYMERDK